MKTTTYLKSIFDSRLYQFLPFTFLLKQLHKIIFTILKVGLKQKLKILWKKTFSLNDNVYKKTKQKWIKI